MDQLIIAAEEHCDLTQAVCTPHEITELFVFPSIVGQVNRTVVLTFLAAAIVIVLLLVAFRRPKLVPSKFQAAMEAVVGFVRDDVAIGIIGPEGVRYLPYLLSIFMLILVGNLFELTPLINFPITSRMALPAFLAMLTYLIFLVAGFTKNGFRYLTDLVWPKSVPLGIRWLVGAIELFSVLVIRPISLAVRLFANLVAGHVMLSILLVTGVVFVGATFTGDVSVLKGGVGLFWFSLGLAIFVFEILVSVLQAYIFTLLSAVYIQLSVHPEH